MPSQLATLLRLIVALVLAACLGSAAARESLDIFPLSSLPPEAHRTLQLIKQGGPFPHPRKDGSIFGNFEKLLPKQPRGYYREYTVPTPGSRDRKNRHINKGRPTATSGEHYYTDDHYRSFRRIKE